MIGRDVILAAEWKWHLVIKTPALVFIALFVAILLSSILLLSAKGNGHPERWALPPKRGEISQAASLGETLWILRANGKLSQVGPGQDKIRTVELSPPVLGICRDGDVLWSLAGDRAGAGTWTLRRLSGAKWIEHAQIRPAGEPFVALTCRAGAATALTPYSFVVVAGSDSKRIALSQPLRHANSVVVFEDGRGIHVGLNSGEFGGGLIRIDGSTGALSEIESHEVGIVCGGLLNPECDPVTGITADPERPDCVLASVGLAHLRLHGRIIRVCGDRVQKYYTRASRAPEPQLGLSDSEPYESAAFFGVTSSSGGVMAAGLDGLYNLSREGVARRSPWPTLKDVDGVRFSYQVPGVVVVMTGINRAVSLGGSTPLLISR